MLNSEFLIDTEDRVNASNPPVQAIRKAMRYAIRSLPGVPDLGGADLGSLYRSVQQMSLIERTKYKCVPATEAAIKVLGLQEDFSFGRLCILRTIDRYNGPLWVGHQVAIAGHKIGYEGEEWFGFSPANLQGDSAGYDRGRHLISGKSLPQLVERLRMVEPYFLDPRFEIGIGIYKDPGDNSQDIAYDLIYYPNDLVKHQNPQNTGVIRIYRIRPSFTWFNFLSR